MDMDMEAESGMLRVAVVGILGRCGWLARRSSTAVAGSVPAGRGQLENHWIKSKINRSKINKK
jgi:hypothetical protein